MLGKLIKYDLKSMLKTIVPLWLTVLVLSVIIMIKFWGANENVIINVENNTVDLILFIVLFCVGIAIVVFNIMFIIQRFWNGLLKEEGYLMFTLPVSTRSLIMAKALSALIISIGSMLVAMASVFIISLSFVGTIGIHVFSDLWLAIRNTFTLLTPSQLAEQFIFLLAGVVSFLAGIYQVYASMAIGQLSNKNRFLLSFFAFVGISVVFSFVASFTDMIPVANTFMDNCIILITDLIALVALHVVTEVLLTKKLNLE